MKFFKINLLVMFLTLINLPFVLYAQGEDLSEYYPLKEGNMWAYEVKEENEISIEKLKIDGKEYVNNVETMKLVYEDGSYDCIGRDFEGIKLYKGVDIDDGNYQVFAPPFILLPFNKELSKEYKCSYLTYNIKGNLIPDLGGEIIMEIKFAGREDITVSAGKFLNCIKILASVTQENRNGSFIREEYITWFAKGVGEVKSKGEDIGYDAEEGATYSTSSERELKRAIVDGIEYGKEN